MHSTLEDNSEHLSSCVKQELSFLNTPVYSLLSSHICSQLYCSVILGNTRKKMVLCYSVSPVMLVEWMLMWKPGALSCYFWFELLVIHISSPKTHIPKLCNSHIIIHMALSTHTHLLQLTKRVHESELLITWLSTHQ